MTTTKNKFVVSLCSRPAPALLLPIEAIAPYLASSPVEGSHKVRIAGRLLHYDPTSGYLLLSCHSSMTALWVDPSVAFDGEAPGVIQREEGLRSAWMITAELNKVDSADLPKTPRDSLPRPIAKKVKILPVLLSAVLVVHTPTLELGEWEEAARARMESGLLAREKRKLALEKEAVKDDEERDRAMG